MYNFYNLRQMCNSQQQLGLILNRMKHAKVKKVQIKTKDETKKYSKTINLPKTDFALWLNSHQRIQQDEAIIKDCGFLSLYNWQRENVKGPEYVLHDGPPYANGLPHMGHAINKVLKDVTIRHKLLQGHRIHYKPGWDCHGLPIELKAMAGKDETSSPLDIRQQARKFAKEAIRDQKALFRSWGVMADWDKGCYFTFDKSYVKNQLQQFYKLHAKGLVYRDVKPVYWSPSSRTALAEAELEYKESHTSVSAYVRVRVAGAPAHWGEEVFALLWTTTPWTLPANQAVAFSPTMSYSIVSLHGHTGRYLVATPLLTQLSTALNTQVTSVCSVNVSDLNGLHYQHPLYKTQTQPFLPAEFVTADKGTGLVHIAPAHGPDDYKLAKKHNMPVVCLVDDKGMYMEEAGPDLGGLAVLTAGVKQVVEMCKGQGDLIQSSLYKHSYPYDWRTNLPVILRASHQWFFNTAAIKQTALEALTKVQIMPERETAGLVAQVQNRPFWCISRQRVWGVPIPVLYTSSGEPVISQELVDHYCSLVDTVGDDFWWSCSLSDLAPPHLLDALQVDAGDLERGQDILDIWLDSGLSWSAVLDTPTADLYLEGVDQFNGWFQSSLLTSVALQETSPYKAVFVHGFAVDENGMKMSKSIGNVVNPQEIVYGGQDLNKQPTYGVDVLRWWVAAHGCQQSNVPVSPSSLTDSKASVQRLRGVMRFLLGTLSDMTHSTSPSTSPYLLDLYMLHRLRQLETQVFEQYNSFQYNKVCKTLINFVANEVSAKYCHFIKDRLYCEARDAEGRRAAQLTVYHVLNTLARLMAPVLPLLAEEVHSFQPVRQTELLFHKVGCWSQPEWTRPDVEELIKLALDVKQQVVQLSPLNCNNWELSAAISAPSHIYRQLQLLQDVEVSSDSQLAEMMQVSSVTLLEGEHTDVQVTVGLAEAHLCERCRKHTASTPGQPCQRCSYVMALT